MALLSLAAADLLAVSEPASHAPAPRAVPVSAYPPAQADRWIGVVPKVPNAPEEPAPDEPAPAAPTF